MTQSASPVYRTCSTRIWSAAFNYILNPTLLTDFRFSYVRYRVNVQSLDYGKNAGEAAGIPGVNFSSRPDTSGLPRVPNQRKRRVRRRVRTRTWPMQLPASRARMGAAVRQHVDQDSRATTPLSLAPTSDGRRIFGRPATSTRNGYFPSARSLRQARMFQVPVLVRPLPARNAQRIFAILANGDGFPGRLSVAHVLLRPGHLARYYEIDSELWIALGYLVPRTRAR